MNSLDKKLYARLFAAPTTREEENALLWAWNYEDVSETEDGTLWSHPGICKEDDPENTDDDGCYTRAKALEGCADIGHSYCELATRGKAYNVEMRTLTDILTDKASAYAWLKDGKPDTRYGNEQINWWNSQTGGISSIIGELIDQQELFMEDANR